MEVMVPSFTMILTEELQQAMSFTECPEASRGATEYPHVC